MKRYMSAKEATEALGITPQTLYTYVSRGLIRSEAGEGRQRRYRTEDVLRLKNRRDPAKLAQEALTWGTPLLDSELTLITDGALYYRGKDVRQLAQDTTIEQVAALLWTGEMSDNAVTALFSSLTPIMLPPLDEALPILARLQILLASTTDAAAYDLRPESVARTGARILRMLAVAVAGRDEALSVGELLSAAWNVDARLINAALILVADHELNVSAFTARVVASADATPYAAVIAGLAAMSGVKHGANIEQVTAFMREVGDPAYARRVIVERLQRGERIPGFGHRLYPGSDPRADTLLDLLRQRYPTPLADVVVEEARAATQREPNIDLALATLEQVAHLPRGSGLALFALGRTVGWIGHAIEQYRSGELIRPRARYVGDMPG